MVKHMLAEEKNNKYGEFYETTHNNEYPDSKNRTTIRPVCSNSNELPALYKVLSFLLRKKQV